MIGDTGTGKTSFLTQLIHRVPEQLPKPTTHLSVFTMRISKPSAIVQLWDSPGDTKYYYQILGIISQFTSIIIFVDVTNSYTYDRARLIADRNFNNMQKYRCIQMEERKYISLNQNAKSFKRTQ